MILRSILVLTLLVVSTGCTSMTSTLLNRDDCDNFTRNGGKHPEKGIPITLRVPTHLKVWIDEEYYLQKTKAEDGKIPLKALNTGKPVISVVTSFDYEEKLFTVDFKRPGAGTLKTDIQMDSEKQYFKQIHTKVVDNTIQEITKIVKQFSVPLGIKTSVGQSIEKNLIVDTRTVAFVRFDINAPDFEQQLMAFFDQHINSCNSCQGFGFPVVPLAGESVAPQQIEPVAPQVEFSQIRQADRQRPNTSRMVRSSRR